VTIERFEDDRALAAALATRVLEAIAANPAIVLGLPTGRTPLGLYRELRERSSGGAVDWSRVRTFNLDACEPSCSTTFRFRPGTSACSTGVLLI
jgi:glucosamine-6-phosphate deaminase